MPSQFVVRSRSRSSMLYADGSDFISQYFMASDSISVSAPIKMQRNGENLNRGPEVVGIQDVGDANLIGPERRRVEAVGRRDHHRRTIMREIAEQPRGEFLCVVDRQLRDAIKRALRLLQKNAGDRRQAFEENIAAMLVLLEDAPRVLLVQFVRADGDELRKARRWQASLR